MTSSTQAPEIAQHLTSFIVASGALWAWTIIFMTVVPGLAFIPLILAVVMTVWTALLAHSQRRSRRT